MKTITIQIGNTDNKLTQQVWATFINDVDSIIRELGWRDHVHFRGGSAPDAYHQNFCWVLSVRSLDDLRDRLAERARIYRQNAIALTVGETEFVAAKPL